MKVIIIIILSGILLAGCNSGSQTNQNNNENETEVFTIITEESVPDNSSAEQEYNSALKKWEQNNVSSYYLKVNYGAFSPTQGTWEVWVDTGVFSAGKFIEEDILPKNKEPE